VDRVGLFAVCRNERVADFVIGDAALVVSVETAAAALRAGDNLLEASSRSRWVIAFALRRAASNAASLSTLARYAPDMPAVAAARRRRSTSAASFFCRAREL
jgi:hypothetical protein